MYRPERRDWRAWKLLGLKLAVTIRLGSRALGAVHLRLLPSE